METMPLICSATGAAGGPCQSCVCCMVMCCMVMCCMVMCCVVMCCVVMCCMAVRESVMCMPLYGRQRTV